MTPKLEPAIDRTIYPESGGKIVPTKVQREPVPSTASPAEAHASQVEAFAVLATYEKYRGKMSNIEAMERALDDRRNQLSAVPAQLRAEVERLQQLAEIRLQEIMRLELSIEEFTCGDGWSHDSAQEALSAIDDAKEGK